MSRRAAAARILDFAECCKFAINFSPKKMMASITCQILDQDAPTSTTPKNDNIVSSTSTMDEETIRIIKKCNG
jgi:hypothetical protein